MAAVTSSSKKALMSAEDLETAARLKQIYLDKKEELGLTQALVGKQMSMTQGNVANYMRGGMPMNLLTVLKFAKALEVDPIMIDPRLQTRFKVSPLIGKTTITVTGTVSGALPSFQTVEARGLAIQQHHLAMEVDTDKFQPMIQQGGIIYIDQRATLEVGNNIVVRFADTNQAYPYCINKLLPNGGLEVLCYARPGYIPPDTDPRLYPDHENPLRIEREEMTLLANLVGTINTP